MAEDYSDIKTIAIFARRINNQSYKIKKYSAKGCGRLRRKCFKIAMLWVKQNIKHIIICHDLDCNDEKKCRILHNKLENAVSKVPNSKEVVCIIIPIQEIEAWLLSDVKPLNTKFSGMKLKEIHNPEKISSPKELIEKRSRKRNCKPRYINTIHNPELAKLIDIQKIVEKCPAFRPFCNFVTNLS